MTTAEILRTQSPETDLEKVLFDRISGVIEEMEDAREEASSYGDQETQFEELKDKHQELIEEVATLMDDTDDAGLMDALTTVYKKWCT